MTTSRTTRGPVKPPVKVTFYSDALYFGGAEGYLALLARHLDRRRFSLSLVLPPDPGAEILGARMRAEGVTEVAHLDRPGFSWLRRLPGMVRMFRRVGGEILHMNLPSCYDAGVSSVAWAARQAGYQRVVSTEHLPMVDRKYRKFPTKLFFSHWVDAVVVNTRSNRELLIERHGMDAEKIRVVPNGVDETAPLTEGERTALRQEWGATPETAVVGIVGRLTRRKGHHFLLEALAPLAVSTPMVPWRLVVVGDGEESERLHGLARDLRLEDRVIWLGHREDATRLMHAFDLLTLPSTIETMPFAIVEGMSARLPVVASAIFGIPEMVVHEETGYLVSPGEVEDLRRRLHSLLGNPRLRDSMGRAGRRRFEARFTAAGMADRTGRIYLNENGPGRNGGLEDLERPAAEQVPA